MDSKHWKQWAKNQLSYVLLNSFNSEKTRHERLLDYLSHRPFTKDELEALHMAMIGWTTGIFDQKCLEIVQDHWINKSATPEAVNNFWLEVQANEKA